MKKNVIALLLSAVLAASSIATVPVFAAEMSDVESTTEETAPVEEDSVEQEEIVEQTEDAEQANTEETSSVEQVNIEETPSAEQANTEESAVIEEEIMQAEEKQAAIVEDVADSDTSGSCGPNVTWKLTGTGTDLTLTISGSGEMNNYDSYSDMWSKISPWYSYRKNIKSIIIENGITVIGQFAFYECANADKVVLPDTLTTIRQWAFGNCSSLTEVILPDSFTEFGYSAFCNCSMLESITFPENLTAIGECAFENCSRLKSVNLPDGLTEIRAYAFCGCSRLTDINIPEGVNEIGDAAFDACTSLTSIKLPDGLTRINDTLFYHCIRLKSITLPEGVTGIGWAAFSECTSLTDINIPENVTELGESVFKDCPSLKSITLPEGVTKIPYEAFRKCTSLTSITLPDGVREIGELAFADCTNLTSVMIPDGVDEIGVRAFHNCGGLTVLTIPNSVMDIRDYAFGEEETIVICFRGTQEEWDDAVGGSVVLYKSLLFSDFSADAVFELPKAAYNYTGNPIEPVVTGTCDGQQLVEGRDYKVSYENNVSLGTATVIVSGIGAYSGTTQLLFKIRIGATRKVTCTNVASGMKVSWEKVNGATRYKVYRDGKHIFTTSALAVTDKEVKYKGGSKFTYKVVATEKNTGDSDLFKTGTYYRLMPVGIKSLTNPSAGKMTVTYDKSSGSSGYVVRYGLKSDMSDAKVITVQGQNTTSRTFGGMKKGKTYYVQARTYKLDNGVRYYSGYCTTKTIKITK